MELFKILGTIAINGAGQAEGQLNNLVRRAQDGGAKMRTGFANIGKAATGLAVTAGAAFAAIGGAMVAVVANTEEYRLAMAKISTAFETVGMTADQGKQMFQDFYGVLGDTGQATEAINHLAMLTNDQQALSEWTTICTGIYAKFGESLPIEGLTEAANETARTGALTGGLADALNWAGVNEDEFQAKLDACVTTQEREALIRETLNGLYTDAGTKYRENAADLIAANEAQARMTDALAVFGEKAQPILTAVQSGFAGIVERAAAFLTEVDMQGITDAINNAFAWFIDTAIPAIHSGVQWVIDHKDMILALVTGIGAAFLAWNVVQIVTGAITVLTTLKTTLGLVRTGQLALNAAMLANPIGIVVAAVAALVAAFVYLWNNCEGFRNFFLNMWENIKAAFASVVEWFKGAAASIGQFFSDAWQGIKNAWSGAGEFFGNVRQGINEKFEKIGDWFSEKFTQAKEAAQNAWATAKEHFANVKQGITNAFASVDSWMGSKFGESWTAVKKAFSNSVAGQYFGQVWNTVKGIFSVVKNVLSGNFSDAWAAIKGVFSGWGNFFSGLWNNIKSIFSNVGATIGNAITNTVKKAVNGVLSTAVKIINGFISAINFAIGVINLIPGVSISKLDKLQTPQLAKGGVVDRATLAMIGEDGAEAVVPLEKNTGWIDSLAEKLSYRVTGNAYDVSRRAATGANYTGALATMQRTLDMLADRLDGLQIVLDTGAVVGGLAPAMDTALGKISVRKGRAQ